MNKLWPTQFRLYHTGKTDRLSNAISTELAFQNTRDHGLSFERGYRARVHASDKIVAYYLVDSKIIILDADYGQHVLPSAKRFPRHNP